MNSLVLLLLPLLLVPPATPGAFFSRPRTVKPENLNLLKMCPPGGASFTMAWNMACAMRKKRSAGIVRERRDFVAPTISQLQTICCELGCMVTDIMPYCSPFRW